MFKINVSTSDSYRWLNKNNSKLTMSFTILINHEESEPTGWSYAISIILSTRMSSKVSLKVWDI